MNRTKEAGLNQLYTELKSTFKASLPEQSYEIESQVIFMKYHSDRTTGLGQSLDPRLRELERGNNVAVFAQPRAYSFDWDWIALNEFFSQLLDSLPSTGRDLPCQRGRVVQNQV